MTAIPQICSNPPVNLQKISIQNPDSSLARPWGRILSRKFDPPREVSTTQAGRLRLVPLIVFQNSWQSFASLGDPTTSIAHKMERLMWSLPRRRLHRQRTIIPNVKAPVRSSLGFGTQFCIRVCLIENATSRSVARLCWRGLAYTSYPPFPLDTHRLKLSTYVFCVPSIRPNLDFTTKQLMTLIPSARSD